MGEYGMYNGQRIKLGTCEDMYYLRADQAQNIVPERGNVNPSSKDDQGIIRFRFPWPDEDHIAPGMFDDYERAVTVPDRDIPLPDDLEHHSIQFSAHAGYLLSLPCPESKTGKDWAHTQALTIHRNGFAGSTRIVQQGYRRGNLTLICKCGGCGARYNMDWPDAELIVVACRAEADRPNRPFSASWWHTVADRIAAGYGKALAEVAS